MKHPNPIIRTHKVCPKCGIDKPIDEFGRHSSRADGHHSHCKRCRKAQWKNYIKTTEKGRALKRAADARAQQKIRDKKRAVVAEMREIGSCLICKESEPACLEFHHVDPELKVASPTTGFMSQTAFRAEIQKCVLLCANCHRKLHAGVVSLPPIE